MVMIPTGIQTLTLTTRRRNFIMYRCPKCNGKFLDTFYISASAQETQHVLSTKESKANHEAKAKEKATENMDKYDDNIFHAINDNHDFTAITRTYKCPKCGEIMPWSGFPAPGLLAKKKIKKKVEELAKMEFEPPKYFNQSNLKDLFEMGYGKNVMAVIEAAKKNEAAGKFE